MIDRFSEDIDITFEEHIGESKRKKLKNVVLKGISEELGLSITNLDGTRSRRDYNAYHFAYESVFDVEDDRLQQFVKLEMVLGSYSFPTEIVEIDNYIGNYLSEKGREDLVEMYGLDSFSMKLQSLERTFIDKVFALCDYYLQGKSKRYSRHLYDLYKLNSTIEFDDEFIKLVSEVRRHRAGMSVCPSAQPGADVPKLLLEFCNNDFYKKDYQAITSYFATDFVSYENVIDCVREIAQSGVF